MNCLIEPGLLQGTVSIPASKSAAHRALICAGLSKGKSVLKNVSDSEDITATIGALQQMGAQICREGSTVTITGIQAPPEHPVTLDCGESGSTLRFLLPVAAALGLTCTITGRGRLPHRPLDAYLRELPWYAAKRHAVSYRIVNFLRMIRDRFCPAPRSYSIYLPDADTRTTLPIKHPTCRWGCRSRGED